MRRRLVTVTIMDLALPGDWPARCKSQHVRDLLGSMDAGEPLQPPAIRKADRTVIFGGDRLAALHLGGTQTCEAWEYDVTEEEAQRMRLVENLHRRHDNRDALKAELVKLEAQRLDERAESNVGTAPNDVTSETSDDRPTQDVNSGQSAQYLPSAPKPGRPKTSKGIAREKAAAAAATTPEAIRSAEKREAARQRHDEGPEVGAQEASSAGGTPAVSRGQSSGPDDSAAPPLAIPGLDIAVALDEVDRHLKAALAGITKLCTAHPELVERFAVQQAKWQVKEGAAALRAMKPADRCPYCKLVASELPNCGACQGSGWVTADQMRDVPPELLVVGEGEGIFVGGEFVALTNLVSTRGTTARIADDQKRGRQRRMKVVDEHGADIAPPPDDGDFSEAWTEEGK